MFVEAALLAKVAAAKAVAAHTAFVQAGGAHAVASHAATAGVHAAINHIASAAAKSGIVVPLPPHLAQSAAASSPMTLEDAVVAGGLLAKAVGSRVVMQQLKSPEVRRRLTATVGGRAKALVS